MFINITARRRLEAVEMSCLRAMCGVTIMQRICSLEIRRCGFTYSIIQTAEERRPVRVTVCYRAGGGRGGGTNI